MINRSHLALALYMLGLLYATAYTYAEEDRQCISSVTCESKPIPICQKNIPYTIRRSGNYELEGNITFTGSGNAITIQADNVHLNLNSFSITLSNPNATGILVKNVFDFVIENGSITNVSSKTQNGFGISIVGSQNGLINNVTTTHNFDGLRIQASTNIQAINSEFLGAADAGAFIINSDNTVFNNDVFDAGSNGMRFSGINQNSTISNSRFPSATFTNLLVQQVTGMLIENSSFNEVAGDPTKTTLVQFGDIDPAQSCHDVIMRNCTIINRSSNTAPEGLGIFQGSGFLIDSCIIDIDNTGQDPEDDLSGIHISNPDLGAGLVASNVIINNCIIQGPATLGIYPDGDASSIVIENCVVTGAQKHGIFLAETSASKVQNNLVTNNGTTGIFIGETSTSNAVLNNTVIKNGFAPVTTEPPTQSGIAITADSSNNTVQSNQVFSNAVFGINNLGSGNTFYFNTAFNNPTNYNGVNNISMPGSPAKSGENISQ